MTTPSLSRDQLRLIKFIHRKWTVDKWSTLQIARRLGLDECIIYNSINCIYRHVHRSDIKNAGSALLVNKAAILAENPPILNCHLIRRDEVDA